MGYCSPDTSTKSVVKCLQDKVINILYPPQNHLRTRILLHLKIDDRKMEDGRLRHILVTAEEHADSKGQIEQKNAS